LETHWADETAVKTVLYWVENLAALMEATTAGNLDVL
jgi:hypothetical protein